MLTNEIVYYIVISIMLSIWLTKVFKNIKEWKSATIVDGTIVGYKYFEDHKDTKNISPITKFYPIVKINNEDVIIKNLKILVKEQSKLVLRLNYKTNEIEANNPFYELALIVLYTIILVIIFFTPSLKFDISYFFYAFLALIITGILQALEQYRNLNTLQNIFNYVRPRNYDSYDKPDINAIKSKKSVTYEEAMLHYYCRYKKSEWWIFIALILFGILITWSLLIKIM